MLGAETQDTWVCLRVGGMLAPLRRHSLVGGTGEESAFKGCSWVWPASYRRRAQVGEVQGLWRRQREGLWFTASTEGRFRGTCEGRSSPSR